MCCSQFYYIFENRRGRLHLEKNDAHLQPFVAINTERATAHGRSFATDICYRMTSFSPSTHLSFYVTSRYGVHLPGTHRICTITVEQINSLSAVHAFAQRSVCVGKRCLAEHIDIAEHGWSFYIYARWSTLVSIANRNKRTIQTVWRMDEPITSERPKFFPNSAVA